MGWCVEYGIAWKGFRSLIDVWCDFVCLFYSNVVLYCLLECGDVLCFIVMIYYNFIWSNVAWYVCCDNLLNIVFWSDWD